MSKKRMIDTKFWSDNFIVDECNALDRLLFLYLLTNERTNIVGIYELSLKTAAFETGIDRDDLQKMLKRLSPKIEYFDGWVYIKNFVDHQQINPNIEKGMMRTIFELPDAVIKKIIDFGIDSIRLAKAFESLTKAFESVAKEYPKPKLKLKPKGIGKKPEKPTEKSSEISKLYYQAIKALDVPVRNNSNLRKKIQDFEKCPNPDEVISYLTFMRDSFDSLQIERKPMVAESLDIYNKRKQIQYLVELDAKKQNERRYA